MSRARSTSSDEEEDFTPIFCVAPTAVPRPSENATAPTQSHVLPLPHGEKVDDALLNRKREREAESVPPPPPVFSEADFNDASWNAYAALHQHHHYPSLGLYERCFIHTSLAASCEAAQATGSTKISDSEPSLSHSGSALPHTIHDVAILYDSLGALLCTIDEVGIARMWRKLPRGVALIAELDHLFSPVPEAEEAEGRGDVSGISLTRLFWVHGYSSLQQIIFVGVEEVASTVADDVTVHVSLRHVNPITYTVEQRSEFFFKAPMLDGAASGASFSVAQHCQAEGPTASPYVGYTRRPAFLVHRYQPHIAFFTSIVPPSTASSGRPLNGVVICPCFPAEKSDAAMPHLHYTPAQLSVANAIVACVQQPAGLERTGTSPCVLVDASGIIDYVTIEHTPLESSSTSNGTTPSALTLKVMAGLAAAPRGSPEASVWRRWIQFSRRQQTSFFVLLRDAQQAAKKRKEVDDGHEIIEPPTDVVVLPCSICMTTDGQYYLITSLRILTQQRCSGRHLTSPGAAGSRSSSTHVSLEVCVHLFKFSSGQCVGSQVRRAETAALSSSDSPSWRRYLAAIARRMAVMAHLEEVPGLTLSSNLPAESEASESDQRRVFVPRALYMWVPEVRIVDLLSIREEIGAAKSPASSHAPKGVPTVQGRQVYVYQVLLSLSAQPASFQRVPVIAALSHAVGEMEAAVRRGDDHLPMAEAAEKERITNVGPLPPTTSALESIRAPLLLLNRTIVASQDLKNFIARSPLGVALGPDAMKDLLAPPEMTSTGVDASSTMIVTTGLKSSWRDSSAALLLYTTNMTAAALDMQRFLQGSASGLKHHNTNDSAVNNGKGDGALPGLPALVQRWEQLRLELRKQREFYCGELLMSATQQRLVGISATAPAAENVTASLDVGDTAKSSTAAQDTTATSPPKTGNASLDTVEATVTALLQGVRPAHPAMEGGHYSLSTTALVHVQRYGTIRVRLLPNIAPLAVENFVRLARRRYYDRLTFHRVIPRLIVQGGCPRGDGTGGESCFDGGAPFKDEALDAFPFFSHTPAVCWLCMANAGPNTNGSQFFLTAPGAEAMPWLNGQHTVFGYAEDGLDVISAVSEVPRDAEDKPRKPIVMERVDII